MPLSWSVKSCCKPVPLQSYSDCFFRGSKSVESISQLQLWTLHRRLGQDDTAEGGGATIQALDAG